MKYMTNKSLLTILMIILCFLAYGFNSCSDNSNESEYQSIPPKFTNILLTSQQEGIAEAGKEFTLTALQSKKGKLLYKAKYNWTIEPSDENIEKKFTQEVIYDKNNADPTANFIIPNKGKYKITFTGLFYISGQPGNYNSTEVSNNGCTITYSTPGIQYYKITITKNIYVQ